MSEINPRTLKRMLKDKKFEIVKHLTRDGIYMIANAYNIANPESAKLMEKVKGDKKNELFQKIGIEGNENISEEQKMVFNDNVPDHYIVSRFIHYKKKGEMKFYINEGDSFFMEIYNGEVAPFFHMYKCKKIDIGIFEKGAKDKEMVSLAEKLKKIEIDKGLEIALRQVFYKIKRYE